MINLRYALNLSFDPGVPNEHKSIAEPVYHNTVNTAMNTAMFVTLFAVTLLATSATARPIPDGGTSYTWITTSSITFENVKHHYKNETDVITKDVHNTLMSENLDYDKDTGKITVPFGTEIINIKVDEEGWAYRRVVPVVQTFNSAGSLGKQFKLRTDEYTISDDDVDYIKLFAGEESGEYADHILTIKSLTIEFWKLHISV